MAASDPGAWQLNVTRRTAVAGGLAAVWAPLLVPGAQAQAVGQPVPLSLNPLGHAIVPVTINGAACLGLIDNGFSATAMDLAYARAKSLVSGEVARVNGAEAQRSVKVKLAMGPMTGLFSPPLIDMSEIPSGQEEKIAAILGRDSLGAMIATFDFEAGHLTCAHPNRRFRPPEGAKQFALARGQGGSHQMTVMAEGEKLHAHVDLGASTPVMVRESVLTRRWLEDGRRWSTAALSTAKGGEMAMAECRVTRLGKLELGKMQLENVATAIYPASHPVFGRHEAVIGAPVLGRFLMILDLRGSRLWLKPNARFGEPFRASVMGLGVRAEGETLVVIHVARGSPAENAGLKLADVIAALDGGPARRARFHAVKPGDRLELQLSDGAKRTLTAAEYY